MNPYRDLPEGVTPHDCEKPNPRCESCGGETSAPGEPCEACHLEQLSQDDEANAREKHLAQTMDFVNKALLGRKETQPIAKAVLEAKVMPQDKWGREQVPCELCGTLTPFMGTKRCDRCWELEKRIEADPELTLKVISKKRELLLSLGFVLPSPTTYVSKGIEQGKPALEAWTRDKIQDNDLLQKTQQLKDCIRESLEWLDDNAPGKAREALRKGLGYGS